MSAARRFSAPDHAHMARALELAPKKAEYYVFRGNLLHMMGKHAEALSDLDQAMTLDDFLKNIKLL